MPTIIEFDKSIFSTDSVLAASYKKLNIFAVDLTTTEDKFVCTLVKGNEISEDLFQKAVEDFRKEVVDQELRLRIKRETEPVRNLILSLAFSRTGLQRDE